MSDVILYDYWRSSASYRVRIALNLAGIAYEKVPVDLVKGDHKSPEHIARNPQGLVPALLIDNDLLTQSLAIIEYLNETVPSLQLLPANPIARAKVRAIAHAIAMDIHPVCNMSVVSHVTDLVGNLDETRKAWMSKFIGAGLGAVEKLLENSPGPLCYGATPTLADICLIPQIYNARRWEVDISALPRVIAIEAQLAENPAFKKAYPQPC
jgi:maleylacetoacetate isomerase